jgi:LacI family transcriptional regulator
MGNALLEKDIVALGRQQPNIVVLNRVFESIRDQCFSADHAHGGTAAAQALLGKGHRRFAVLAGPRTSADNLARIGAFMAELARAGIGADAVPMLHGDFSPEGGWACTEALLARGAAFTALFCANDEMAVGALSHLQQVGISVPGEVSVMGYDDTQTAEFCAPRLTSVHIPLREVTVAGMHCLLNRCYGESLPVAREFPVSVTWRASVGTPREA